jgi:hypothetical protein
MVDLGVGVKHKVVTVKREGVKKLPKLCYIIYGWPLTALLCESCFLQILQFLNLLSNFIKKIAINHILFNFDSVLRSF